MEKATYEQMHQIAGAAKKEFGDINASGYLTFSQWLGQHFGISKPEQITGETAQQVLDALQGKREEVEDAEILDESFEIPEFFPAVILTLSKVYMYGVIEGRKGTAIPSDPQEFIKKLKEIL